jgi:hypothetical protein
LSSEIPLPSSYFFSTLLDAFNIYDHTLAELYGRRSIEIKELIKKIIESKGKY